MSSFHYSNSVTSFYPFLQFIYPWDNQFKMLTSVQAIAIAWMTATVSAASSKFGAHAVLEEVVVPSGFKSVGAPAAATAVKLQIALKQRNINGLTDKLMDLANHESPNYAKWLTKEEVAEFTAPTDETLSKVKAWLAESGIAESAISQPSPDWLTVEVPLSHAESLLNTKYGLYHDEYTGDKVIRTPGYSLPEQLHEHIDTIQPTTVFGRAGAIEVEDIPEHEKRDAAGDCSVTAAAPCIRDFYKVDYKPVGKSFASVTEFGGNSASQSDLQQYKSQFDPSSDIKPFEVDKAGGGSNSGKINIESALDTQAIASLTSPNPTYLFPGSSFSSGLEKIINYLASNSKGISTVSTSYSSHESSTPASYATRMCNEFAKAGSQGISIFFSTGDYGTGDKGQTCKDYVPHFPAVCPYVTGVAATTINADGSEEVAIWKNGRSSGAGFSAKFDQPDYQKDDVAKWLAKTPADIKAKIRTTGRAYPDVSTVGTAVAIVLDGADKKGTGTSASSPFFASFITLINDYRVSQGKPTLGFLNPRLYGDAKVRAAFNDVTKGNNGGCGTVGFAATEGWDGATGLGTPNFTALRAAFST